MRLNRALQGEILAGLSLIYPERLASRTYLLGEVEPKTLVANLSYLAEHGLVETAGSRIKSNIPLGLQSFDLNSVKITARGLDFLEQDGGLSAILGTVTVKLHADTIKDMLESRILSAELPPEEKKRFVDTLRELPGEALKTFTNKLVEMACDNPQAVVTALSRLVP